MKHLPIYNAAAIRADYSRHVLRAMLQGFAPLSLRAFVGMVSATYFGA